MIKSIIWFFSSFIFIFHVPVLGLGIESMISGFFLFLWGLQTNIYKRLFVSKTFLVSFSMVIGMFLLGLLWTSLSKFELQFLSPLIKNILILFFASGMVASGYSVFKSKLSLALIFLFLCQMAYIWIGLLAPNTTINIQLFMHGESYDRFLDNYIGQRGLGLAGGLAFGLASSVSAFLIFIILDLKSANQKFYLIAPLILLISIVPMLSIGRSTILGILLALFLVMFFSSKKIYSATIFLIPIIGSIVYISQEMGLENISDLALLGRFFEYAAQPLVNFILTNELYTTSTSSLFDMYYEIPRDTLLHGDGIYYNNDGSYYGYTDAGYMRFTLFFGLPLSIIIYIFYSFYLWIVSSLFRNRILIFLTLFILSFILQIKGDVVAYGVDLFSVLFVYTNYFWMKNVFNEEHELLTKSS